MSDGFVHHGNITRKGALSKEEIEKRFGFHRAAIEGPEASAPKHAYLRRQFTMFAETLSSVMGEPSRESALAFTALEEASMWFHKSIAAKDPLIDE